MSETAIAWCGECGTQREPGTAFCGNCGTAVDEATATTAASGGAGVAGVEDRSAVTYSGDGSDATMLAGSPTAWSDDVTSPRPDIAASAGYAAGPVASMPDYAVVQQAPYPPAAQRPAQKSRGVLIGAAVAFVAVAAAGTAFAVLGGDSGADDSSAPVVTTTVTASPTALAGDDAPAPAAGPAQEAGRTVSRDNAGSSWPIQSTVSGISGEYRRASSLNSVTSRPFAGAVGEAYAAAGADGGSTNVDAYSSVTGKTYSMWCEAQSDTTVLCTGGNNARVLLW